MSNDDKIYMACDDRDEYKYREEQPIVLDPETQAKYDELAKELMESASINDPQAA